MSLPFAPGARVLVRDCEWVVRRVDATDDGGFLLTVDGLSELVSGKSAQFLTQLEGEGLQVLDPAETRLQQDTSPGFERSHLFLETQLRQITPADEKIHLGHQAAMDTVPYQLDPALQALKQPRQRILIADDVGLGKTLEAGILTTELIRRGQGKRILVLTLKSMMTQFQKEFWNRFTIPLTRLDSAGLQRVRNRIPGHHNPFYYYDKTIISIDTLKQDNEYRRHLEQAYWDIIIIDEAHNVAERASGSQRAKLAQLLASRSDTLIMLSATPHDGRARSFASLMNMLDPTAISDLEDYAVDDYRDKGLVVRRFKKDIRDQVQQEFKERQELDLYVDASTEEEAAYQALVEVPFTYRGEFHSDKNGQLIRVGLQKALFSSPAAARVSVEQRIKKLSGTPKNPRHLNQDEQTEINALQSLQLALQNIGKPAFSKYQRLIKLLQSSDFGWKKTNSEDRLVIFSERIETLSWLEQALQDDLKLKQDAIAQLHGGLSDQDQQKLVEEFGKPGSKLRVLLCSDVASEGINLHYLSHRVIHFDLPWSLMVLQQRNGRVDRYGQTQTPIVTYLLTRSQHPTIRGDLRILEILKEKEAQAYKNIGDPASFMKAYSKEGEEQITEEAMAQGVNADTFNAQYQPDTQGEATNAGEDLLALFLNPDAAKAAPVAREEVTVTAYSLFKDDLDFAHQCLKALNRESRCIDFTYNEASASLKITPPEDLKHRFSLLPSEILADEKELLLTTQRDRYEEEIQRSRQDENAWPKVHYLWPQHPAIEWLEDRIRAQVARHSAQVLVLPASQARVANLLHDQEAVFLVSGMIPNRKSHPRVQEWFAVRCNLQTLQVEGLEIAVDWLQRLDLTQPLQNPANPLDLEPLEALRAPAINAVRSAMQERLQAFNAQQQPRLQAQLKALQELKQRQIKQLDLNLEASGQAQHFKQSRREQRLQQIERIFKDYHIWVEDTLTLEDAPYMQILAVLVKDKE